MLFIITRVLTQSAFLHQIQCNSIEVVLWDCIADESTMFYGEVLLALNVTYFSDENIWYRYELAFVHACVSACVCLFACACVCVHMCMSSLVDIELHHTVWSSVSSNQSNVIFPTLSSAGPYLKTFCLRLTKEHKMLLPCLYKPPA